MHGGMFDAARILIDRQPVVALDLIPRNVIAVNGLPLLPIGADVGVVVPIGADKGVQGIGIALGWTTTLGAVDIQKALVRAQRTLARGLELGIIGQQHGQILVGNRNRATFVAVDDGNGRAPHALAAHQPIAQTVVDIGLANAFLF